MNKMGFNKIAKNYIEKTDDKYFFKEKVYQKIMYDEDKENKKKELSPYEQYKKNLQREFDSLCQQYPGQYINLYEYQKLTENRKRDKGLVLRSLKFYPEIFYNMPEHMKLDKDIVMKAVKYQPGIIEQLNEEQKKDKDIIRAALNSRFGSFSAKSISWAFDDREFIKEVAGKMAYGLMQIAPEHIKKDKEIMLSMTPGLVKGLLSNSLLKYFDESLLNDREVVLEIVKNNGYLITELPNFIMDKELACIAVSNHSYVFPKLPQAIRDDEEVFKAAFENEATSIKHSRFKNVKKYALEAIKKNYFMFESIANELKDDKEICFAAVEGNPYNYKDISERMKRDRDLAMLAILKNPNIYEYLIYFHDDKEILEQTLKNQDNSFSCIRYASERLRNDKKLMSKFVHKSKYGWAFKDMGPSIKSDYELCKLAVFKDASVFEYIDPIFRNDKEICFQAIKEKPFNYRHISDEMKKDRELALLAIKGSSGVYDELIYFYDDKEIFEIAIDSDCSSYGFIKKASDRLRNDKSLMAKVLKKGSGSWVFEVMGPSIKSDYELCKSAISLDGSSIAHVSKELRGNKELAELALFGKHGSLEAFQYVNADYRGDKGKIFQLFKNYKEKKVSGSLIKLLEFGTDEIKDDIEVVYKIINECQFYVGDSYMSPRIWNLIKNEKNREDMILTLKSIYDKEMFSLEFPKVENNKKFKI